MKPCHLARWAAALAVVSACAAIAPAADARYVLETTIAVPPSPQNNVTPAGNFNTFDISFFDAANGLDYFADRSNASVDIISGSTLTFVGRVGGNGQFEGQRATNSISGPDGVLVANPSASQNQLWAGDGNSTLKSFDINSSYAPINGTVANDVNSGINTGGSFRVDEGSFDPKDNIVAFANNADTPPFLTLVNAATGAIIKKVVFDGTNGTPLAGNGIEASVWDPLSQKFYVSVPQIGTSSSDPGGIAELDAAGNVIKTFDFASFGIGSCSPSGLSVNKAGVLAVNCSNANTQTILFNPSANSGNGALVATFTQFSGGDEDWYDPANGFFYFAASSNASGPVLGIIDGNNDTFYQDIATSPGAHSVAVDPLTGDVFMPFGGIAGNTTCPAGCVAVFTNVAEPGSLALIAAPFLGLLGLAWRRRPASRLAA
jgi:hypothetical protein